MSDPTECVVEHGTATDWDDAGKGVDYVTVLINGMKSLAWILVQRHLCIRVDCV